jgi:hypothetical protein
LPARIGVGDVILYSADGTLGPSQVAFMAGRTSANDFQVQAADGGTPVATSIPDTHWSIFRAYVSLVDAVYGNENPGIPAALADFDAWPAGKDLVASRQIWNIACYADAPDTIDDGAVIVSAAAWNTDAAHYLRIFAPRQPGEVGISQRHAGAYDATKYQLVRTANGGNHLIDIFAGFVRVEGLQVVDLAQNSPDADINAEVSDASDVRISESILRGNVANAQLSTGVAIAGQARGSLKVWNSVLQGFSAACVFDNTIAGSGATTYLYNNTLSDCSPGLDDRFATTLAKNDIFAAIPPGDACVADQGVLSVLSDYNLCNLDEAMRGAHSRKNAAVHFVNASSGDFHLAPDDTAAAGQGADLSSDPDLAFADDVDAAPRSVPWDIGADQR